MGVKHAEAYDKQMQDIIKRGIARKLSKKEQISKAQCII